MTQKEAVSNSRPRRPERWGERRGREVGVCSPRVFWIRSQPFGRGMAAGAWRDAEVAMTDEENLISAVLVRLSLEKGRVTSGLATSGLATSGRGRRWEKEGVVGVVVGCSLSLSSEAWLFAGEEGEGECRR